MSRMNAAWSSEPPWAEAVPAIFKEPMTIAFGGAILAHAIFFLGLPVVAGSEKQPDVQPVATTVLTDKERSEVPADVSQSQFSTGSLLPGNNGGLIVPSIPSNPATPGGTVATPGLASGFGQLNEPAFSNGGYSAGSNSSDNSDFNRQLAEITRRQKEADQKAKELAKDAAAQNSRNQTAPTEGIKPGMAPTPADLGVKTSALPPDNTQPGTPKPTTATTETPPQRPNRPSDANIIAAAPEFYAFNPKLTGPTIGDRSAVGTAISTWGTRADSKEGEILKNSGQTFPEIQSLETQTKTLPYPTEINTQPVAVIPDYAQKVKEGYGTAIVGFAVSGQGGKPETEPVIIQSTGYKVLDDYAIAYIKNKQFLAKGGRSKLHYMVIPIDPPVNKPTA
jgi:hypothetical protein